MTFGARIGTAGRVVVPAAIRDELGLKVGDRVEFKVSRDRVVLAPYAARLTAIWAGNHGHGGRYSTGETRAEDTLDVAGYDAKLDRIERSVAADTRSEEQITADLLGSLGLS